MPSSSLVPKPKSRTLRIFPFDPSIGASLANEGLSEITISIPWEEKLEPGPVGEYLEVVDADPASSAFYRPVDLNDPGILAQNGLAPMESNPQFHQQMVYAVAMATIGHFERALGRVVLWSDQLERGDQGEVVADRFVRRLRLYPHALRDRNAYYSPEKKAVLFGYFPMTGPDSPPNTLVFTCLSHDIIAHEMTHALLDGVHPRFNEPMNVDVLAFHEAFADIVAIFQRFSFPGVLRHQIDRTRGNLGNENMLAQLAQQFGRATGRKTALRDALGGMVKGRWKPNRPNPTSLSNVNDPHERGGILVAAVFGAFMKIYRRRTADLFRLASGGTGVLEDGDIHPDLTGRLAEEASDCALTVLRMCIRAIDYCPPVNLSFGDYLRALITADYDEAPIERRLFRLAFIESFREWGIFPGEHHGVTVESLLWPTGQEIMEQHIVNVPTSRVQNSETKADRRARADLEYKTLQGIFTDKSFSSLKQGDAFDEDDEQPDGSVAGNEILHASFTGQSRFDFWRDSEAAAGRLHAWLHRDKPRSAVLALGIVIPADPARRTIFRTKSGLGRSHAVKVHAVRVSTRLGDNGWAVPDLVVEISQRRRGYFDDAEQKTRDLDGAFGDKPRGDFIFRAGCTLLMNPTTQEIRRVIRSDGRIDDDKSLARMRRYLTFGAEPTSSFASPSALASTREPFALLHRNSGG